MRQRETMRKMEQQEKIRRIGTVGKTKGGVWVWPVTNTMTYRQLVTVLFEYLVSTIFLLIFIANNIITHILIITVESLFLLTVEQKNISLCLLLGYGIYGLAIEM